MMTWLLPEGHEDAVDRDERSGFYGDVYGRMAKTEREKACDGMGARSTVVSESRGTAWHPVSPRSVFARLASFLGFRSSPDGCLSFHYANQLVHRLTPSTHSDQQKTSQTNVEFVREIEDDYGATMGGSACLVKRGDEYFVVSSVPSAFDTLCPETLAFAADKDGEVTSWMDVAGGRYMTRDETIRGLAS